MIISSLEDLGEVKYPKVSIESSNKLAVVDSILTINDYVKLMVVSFQNKYPDTELIELQQCFDKFQLAITPRVEQLHVPGLEAERRLIIIDFD